MVDLILHLDDEDLRRRFGSATHERAVDYVGRRKVLSCRHGLDEEGNLDVRGDVEGSAGEVYHCAVRVGLGGQGLWTRGRCSCPVGEGCKHAVALLLTVRTLQAAQGPGGPGDGGGDGRGWERRLSTVLDELEAGAVRSRGGGPLAIQVELGQRSPSAGYHGWSTPSSRRGSLRVRPLRQGARGGWVRSGVSWQNLQHADARRGDYRPEQLAVLAELFAAYRAAQRNLYFGGAEPHLVLSSFGASLWGLLARCGEAGVPLVPGAGLESVSVLPAPVDVRVDVLEGSGSDARVRLGIETDGHWYGAQSVDVMGESGHGVALWRREHEDAEWSLTLAPAAKPVGPEVRRMLAVGEDLLVPAADRPDLLGEYLPRLQRHIPVTSSDGSVPVPEAAEPRLCLGVEWREVDEVALTWSWRYRVADDDRVYRIDETRGMRGVRRPDQEGELLQELLASLTGEQAERLCVDRDRAAGLRPEQVLHDVAAIAFVEDVLPGLEGGGLVEVDEAGLRPDYREAEDAPLIRFAAPEKDEQNDDGRTDWLDLEVEIRVGDQFIALAHLLRALTEGRRRIVMKSGVHIRTDLPAFRRLADLVRDAGELHEQPRDTVRIAHHDLGLWDELAEVGIVDAQAAQWVRAAQAVREVDSLPEVEALGVEAELRHYQSEGLRWLAFLQGAGLGGILADDMGLGKTLQTLALVAHARRRGAAPFLVVAPTSVVSAWAHEAATFTPGLVVETVTESHSRRGTPIASLWAGADVVVTSYTLYRLEVDAYTDLEWGGLVLDEAQTVKNHQGKTYQAVRRLDVPFRLALTGTPLENRLMELWSLLSIVAPGLYPHPQRFAEHVATPVERLGDTGALERFRRRIRPFLLRRTKELVAADLPPKQEQVLQVRLGPRHRRVYDTHLQRERQTVLGLVEEDFDKHRIAIFRSLTRLRRLSLDAGLVDEEHDGLGSAKVDVLVDHLHELVAEGHRALVFSQFTSFLRRVRARLEREGIASTYLDGSTRDRTGVVEGFRAGQAPVFLISLKAGGVGLTLVEADYVFVLDPWWNPAVEAQAVDRAHRIGQSRPVMVYRLVASDTIEEKVMELKARKAALFADVVDGDGSMAAPVEAADVRALFTS